MLKTQYRLIICMPNSKVLININRRYRLQMLNVTRILASLGAIYFSLVFQSTESGLCTIIISV